MDTVKIEKLQYLEIGMRGESNARIVPIDMSSWVEELEEQYPNICFHLLFKAYNETVAIPMPTTYDEATHILTWEVTQSATSVEGVGYTEVRALDYPTDYTEILADPDSVAPNLLKKSRIIPTLVENSVSGVEGGTVPAAEQDWVNQVLATKDQLINILAGAITEYQNSESGTLVPSGEWTAAPHPQKGSYLWSRVIYVWGTGDQTYLYLVSYIGQDGSGVVTSVNGLDGVVVLDGSNIYVDSQEEQEEDLETIAHAFTRVEGAIDDNSDDIAGIREDLDGYAALDSRSKVAIGNLPVTYSDTAPENPAVGDIWLKPK